MDNVIIMDNQFYIVTSNTSVGIVYLINASLPSNLSYVKMLSYSEPMFKFLMETEKITKLSTLHRALL